ncbi:MAG: RnfABCDGE type electron transport complex subunit E [Faecalimonas sp.]
MNKCTERLFNGLIKENPTFVLMLGMCPTLAVTTSAINGLGMGLTTTVVLVMSNMLISMLRKIIPDSARVPSFIVIVASFVTMVQFLLEGFIPSLYDSLGLYIPLIVVNCIILGRAESYASKNPVLPSIFDGLGMGLGFTVGLTAIGMVREIIGQPGIDFCRWKIMQREQSDMNQSRSLCLLQGHFLCLPVLWRFRTK